MANEAGDMKILGNFSKLIELVSVNADYNPANPAITVASLNTKKTAGSTAVSAAASASARTVAARRTTTSRRICLGSSAVIG